MILLAADIGNTNINFGIFINNRLVKEFKIPAKEYSLKRLKQGIGKVKADEAVISSVVPAACVVLGKDLRKLLHRPPYILGKDLVAPIKNMYRHPKRIGQDRLVNAYAGAMLYGVPLIVVDCGTAVTFDLVSKNNEYLGGMILPGLRVSLRGLFENTALVPKIKLKRPKEFIGRDTESGVLSGLVFGYAALIDELSVRIKEKIGKEALVIGTGGDMKLVGRYCRRLDKIDPGLTLKGLNLIMRASKRNLCCKSRG